MTVRGAVAALCLAVLVAGCGADADEPKPLPPVESASPSAVALPVPSEAAAETPQGAVAFARYYFRVLEHALAVGDATRLRQISDTGCDSCKNLIGAVEDAGSKGQKVRGARFVVEFAESPPVEQGVVVVEIRYHRQPGELVDENGAVVSAIAPEGPVNAQIRLRRSGPAWSVLGFRQVTS